MIIVEIAAIGHVFGYSKTIEKVVVRTTESQLLIKDGAKHILIIQKIKDKKVDYGNNSYTSNKNKRNIR